AGVADGVKARGLEPEMLPWRPTFATADVSFISLRLVLPAALACAAPVWRAITLVKPQFEAGRDRIRRGVVREPAVREQVLQDLCAFVTSRGPAILGVCDSSHPGPAGNREYLPYLASPGPPLAQERQVDVNAEIRDAVYEDGGEARLPGVRRAARKARAAGGRPRPPAGPRPGPPRRRGPG